MASEAYISRIAYDIELLLHRNRDATFVEVQELVRQTRDFPSHLQIVDAFYCHQTSANGVAFLDTRRNEIIIGHAGTNLDKSPIGVARDMFANVTIALGGIFPNSLYKRQIDQFINRVRENNREPIMSVTGHSLGGMKAQATGIRHNIPFVVPLNAAPLWGNPIAVAALLTVGGSIINVLQTPIMLPFGAQLGGMALTRSFFHERALEEMITGHLGITRHFYTDDDLLMNVVRSTDSFFIGEVVNLGPGGHGIEAFFEHNRLEIMEQKLMADRKAFEALSSQDFSVFSTKLIPRNLFSSTPNIGSILSQGSIKITPTTLRNLATNIRQTINGRIHVMKTVNTEMRDINNQIGSSRNNRIETLIGEIHQHLLSPGELADLFDRLNAFYELAHSIRNTLTTMTSEPLGTGDFLATLANWHGTGISWLLDGRILDFSGLIQVERRIRNEASNLLQGLREDRLGDFVQGHRGGVFSYPHNNGAAAAIISRIHGIESGATQILHGTGKRARLNDGIQQAVADYLEAKIENTENKELFLIFLARNIDAVVSNAEALDQAAGRMFSQVGTSLSFADAVNLLLDPPSDTKQEPSFLGVNENLTAVRNEQTQVRRDDLTELIIRQLEPILRGIVTEMRGNQRIFENLVATTTSFQSWMGQTVSSVNLETNRRENHHLLGRYLSPLYRESVTHFRQHIDQLGSLLWEVTSRADKALQNLSSSRHRLEKPIREAIYPQESLGRIESGRKFVQGGMHATFQEMVSVEKHIDEASSGLVSEGLQSEVRRLRKFLDTGS